jgi:4-amino-4-deoxy-L-arabinose transferase-like glycosyltransferase
VTTRRVLSLILLTGLALRFLILAATIDLGPRIVDEQHYRDLALNLLEGRGFASASGPTSLRPPLYPAMMAAVWSVAGAANYQAVRVVQIAFGMATAALVFWLGRTLWNDRAGLFAAAIVAFYPTLVLTNFLLLTETVFTFLLTAFVAIVVALVGRPRLLTAAAAGGVLALAALTRSIAWPLPVVLVPLLLWALPGPLVRRFAMAACLTAAFVAVIAPWSVRNTRLQRVPVVIDTIGGLNLMMGNYAHTPHRRIWDAVSMRGEKNWVTGIPAEPPGGGQWTEGQKERWARAQAVEYMRQHPVQTLWRSIIKATDFWALDRDFIAGIAQGLFSPPAVLGWLLSLAMLLAFPLVLGLAVLGAWFTPPDWRIHVLLLLVVFFFTALHAIVFGHPRYRLPLTPIFALYAGAALAARSYRRLRDGWPSAAVPAGVMAAFAGVWIVQFVVRDWPRVKNFLGD